MDRQGIKWYWLNAELTFLCHGQGEARVGIREGRPWKEQGRSLNSRSVSNSSAALCFLVERNCFIFSVLLNHDAPKMGNRMSGMCWEPDGYAPLFADGFPCHESIACYKGCMHTEFCKHETVVVGQDICEESGVYYERKSIDCSHQDYDC